MPILKKIKGSYSNDDALFRLVNYILDPNKMPNRLVGGLGVYFYNAAESMNDIRCIFNHSGRQAEHYVLSFTIKESEKINTQNALKLGYAVCEFFENVQVLFAYHECKDESNASELNHNLHIHFAVGTTNINTGKKYYTNKTEALRFRDYTEAVLNEMGISDDYLGLKFG